MTPNIKQYTDIISGNYMLSESMIEIMVCFMRRLKQSKGIRLLLLFLLLTVALV